MNLLSAPTELRPVVSITVSRESRQRTTLDKDIEQLAEQMAKAGQIQPIVIHQDGRLVAGERRLEAAKRLGWKYLRATVVEYLSEHMAFLIELQENIARRALSWQDECRAVMHYHDMRAEEVPGWNARGTSGDVGYDYTKTCKLLRVAAHLDDPEVANCQTFQGALNLLLGRAERNVAAAQSRSLAIGDVMSKLLSPATGTKEERTAALTAALLSGDEPEDHDPLAILDAGAIAESALREARVREEQGAAAQDQSPILTADFLEWVPSYEGPMFDVLHVDFPYGKGYSGSGTRRTGSAHISPTYKDSPDVFWQLLAALLEHQDRIAHPVAHCVLWFDMEYYQGIRESFDAAGWKAVQPYPLLWTKPYQGVAADPRRRPRHCYETALLFSRGDRGLVRLDQDYFQGRKDENLHISQKSLPMLKHFLSMLVDEHTAVLDPTCGSGTALAAARQLGASRVLGLELDESNAEVARFVLERPSVDEEPEL